MDGLMSIKPGLVVWTMINFGIFLILLISFGGKSILKGLRSRENSIQESIDSAAAANAAAQKLLEESKLRLDTARQEMAEVVAKGREQAEQHIKAASEEANRIKTLKVEEARKEIENERDAALQTLRNEVADLVVIATEKILMEKLDKEKDYKLIESFVDNLPKN